MVDVGQKASTRRIATAIGKVWFSNPEPARLITNNKLKKGDVLAVARVAGIMAAKKTSEIVPLCHPIAISKVSVDLTVYDGPNRVEEEIQAGHQEVGFNYESGTSLGKAEMGGRVSTQMNESDKGPKCSDHIKIEASVECVGPTGVEMEALMAVNGAALTVYDMCKAVDKHMKITDIQVVRKEGGRSGNWRDQTWETLNEV